MNIDPRFDNFFVSSRLGVVEVKTLVDTLGQRTSIIFIHGVVLPYEVFVARLMLKLSASQKTNSIFFLDDDFDIKIKDVWRIVNFESKIEPYHSISIALTRTIDALRGPDALVELRDFVDDFETKFAESLTNPMVLNK